MNRITIAVGAVTALSLVVVVAAGAYLNGRLYRSLRLPARTAAEEQQTPTSLEQDLREIFALLPLAEISQLIELYVRHDPQIGDTVAFINDMTRYIRQELWRIPQVQLFVFVAQELGMDTGRWSEDTRLWWKSLPPCQAGKTPVGAGGLTGMIRQILRVLPKEELHRLLCRKAKESKNFKTMLLLLRSQQFYDLCTAVQLNPGLQRNFHWAKESGIEAIFAVELFGDLYAYLTQQIY